MEFYSEWFGVEYLLNEALLRLAFFAFLTVFSLLQFFHEVALTVTMQPGFVAVFAKFGCYVLAIQLIACKNEVSLECGANQRSNKHICNKAFQHTPAKVYADDGL